MAQQMRGPAPDVGRTLERCMYGLGLFFPATSITIRRASMTAGGVSVMRQVLRCGATPQNASGVRPVPGSDPSSGSPERSTRCARPRRDEQHHIERLIAPARTGETLTQCSS